MRFDVTVAPHVLPQIRFLHERFTTLFALVQIPVRVVSHVFYKVLLEGE